ncbi:DUF6665 family protein [Mesorhizobium sp. SP-1A]|uniref:DUF6665 family protein n=1 Tax=Mesorhizobium sp. SP-1A TaxID=3077840 RepID=UPI0028F7290C|nr:DUF6665 family protein [Mesorhizobium sp. SP-1A]
MSLRPPSGYSGATTPEVFFDALGHEILAEKASALGRAGARAETALARLRAHAGEETERRRLLAETAEAVYAWFIQRELCGFRRHDSVIREFSIPREVLVRLGAK